MHARTLAYQLGLSHKILEMNTGDVSHEQSLVTPPRAEAASTESWDT